MYWMILVCCVVQLLACRYCYCTRACGMWHLTLHYPVIASISTSAVPTIPLEDCRSYLSGLAVLHVNIYVYRHRERRPITMITLLGLSPEFRNHIYFFADSLVPTHFQNNATNSGDHKCVQKCSALSTIRSNPNQASHVRDSHLVCIYQN